jgi:hypothetical protein
MAGSSTRGHGRRRTSGAAPPSRRPRRARRSAGARAAGMVVRPSFAELGEQLSRLSPSGRAARGVEAVELFRLRLVDDGEEVAADAAAGGLHEAERGVGGDGGVDGRAALAQDVEADLRRERLAGADHAVLGDDLGTGGKGAAGDAVGLGGQWEAERQRQEPADREPVARGGHARRRTRNLPKEKPAGLGGWAGFVGGVPSPRPQQT